MKRILSLIMSVLMIATMFCGMAINSSALIDYDSAEHSTNADGYIAKVTPVVADNGDGTYDVVWYMDDYATYGWHRLDIKMLWTGVDGVVEEYASGNAIINVWDLRNAAVDGDANLNGKTVYNGTARKNTDLGVDITGALGVTGAQIGIESSAAGLQMALSKTFLEDIIGLDAADYNYNDTYGFPIGRGTFKLSEGSTVGTFYTEIYTGNVATDDSTGQYAYTKEYFDLKTATIETTPAVPALPAGITLEVQEGVSARKDTYNGDHTGLRFTTVATATDWTNVSEMGTAIVKKGTKPGVDTTLAVPARVDIDGKYLQAHTKDENGKYVFTPGVTTDEASVTYTGVISNIKDANLDVEFEAYGYIIVDGVTYYSANSVSACYSDILEKAQNDETLA